MGARQHSTRALAAFDRLLLSQMETAVFIPPMLATRLEDPRRLADARYIAEPKLDGQRVQLHVRGHRTVCAFSRPGRELIRLPGLAWLREVRWPIASAVLDGEAVAGDGSEGIQAVFEACNRPDSPMAFTAFDLNDLSQRRLARHRTRGGETPEVPHMPAGAQPVPCKPSCQPPPSGWRVVRNVVERVGTLGLVSRRS
jgi:ATP-dependent DNA ligase